MTKTKAYRKTNTKAKTQTKEKKAIGLQTNTCEQWSGRLAVSHFSAELNGRREIARKWRFNHLSCFSTKNFDQKHQTSLMTNSHSLLFLVCFTILFIFLGKAIQSFDISTVDILHFQIQLPGDDGDFPSGEDQPWQFHSWTVHDQLRAICKTARQLE